MTDEEFEGLIIVPTFAPELVAMLGDIKRMSDKLAASLDKPSLLLEVAAGAGSLRGYIVRFEQLLVREGLDVATERGLERAATFMTDLRGERGHVFSIELPTVPDTVEELLK